MKIRQLMQAVPVVTDEYIMRKNIGEGQSLFTLKELAESQTLLKKIKNYVEASDLEVVNSVLTILSDIEGNIHDLLKQNEV